MDGAQAGNMADVSFSNREADVPNERNGDEFNAPEFMTLDEAKGRLDDAVFRQVRDDVWPNVVQVIVPMNEGHTATGTGFVFKGPHSKLVMTNYHVVSEWNGKLEDPVLVKFGYDKPDTGETIKVQSFQYYSKDGVKVNADQYDFCTLELVEDPPAAVNGILMDLSERTLDYMFNYALQQAVGIKDPKGIIIGHPRGSYKRISIVNLTPCEDKTKFTRKYTAIGTRPGSSGSPLVLMALTML